MSDHSLSRRRMLAVTVSGMAAAGLMRPARAASSGEPSGPFRYCLNTGTIRGHKIPIDQEVDVAARAGYQAIEPWIEHVNRYRESGASLADLKKKIAGLGLTVESAIGFPRWAVDDEKVRAEGLDQMKRDMETVAAIGGKRIAAPPAGINGGPAGMDLRRIAERYRAVCELGDQMGVIAELEIWGPSQNVSRLADAAFVTIDCGHPKACLLPDVYHMYRGGSDFHGLKLLSGAAIQVFHMNDYPADPPREKARDSDRVYPGDGIAPLDQILRDLAAKGSVIVLSLELFNPTYHKQDVNEVARTGLAKMKAAVEKALS